MIKWLIGLFILNRYIDSKVDQVRGEDEEWPEEKGSPGVVRVGCFLLLLVVLIGVIYGLRQ